MFAIDKPAELKGIGEDEIGQRGQVALHLVGAQFLIEIDVKVFRFDMADRQIAPHHLKIGRTTCNPARLVRRSDTTGDGFEQRLERGAERMFSGNATGGFGLNRSNVG